MSIELQTDRPLATEDEELEEMAGGEHGEVSSALNGYLFVYVSLHDLGYVFDAQTNFDIPGLTRAKQPDVAFVKKSRLPQRVRESVPLAPDLAVEVVSPTDTLYGVFEKAQEYQNAGVSLVWVVSPFDQTLWVYRLGFRRQELSLDAELSGEDVIPGFKMPVRAVFERDSQVKSDTLRRLLS